MISLQWDTPTNGAIKRANEIIFIGISKKLFSLPKGKWVEDLIAVVCCHNTSETCSTKFTPVKLLYGEEAVTPEQIRLDSARTTTNNPPENHIINIETTKAQKLQAALNLSKYQDKTRPWRDKKVIRKDIKPEDLRKETNEGKLQSKWEGPYLIGRSKKPGSFHLFNSEGEESTHTWNADSLKR